MKKYGGGLRPSWHEKDNNSIAGKQTSFALGAFIRILLGIRM
jgi:hypothetical protein